MSATLSGLRVLRQGGDAIDCGASGAGTAAARGGIALAGHQLKASFEEAVNGFVRLAGHAGDEQHVGIFHSAARTGADLSADDKIHAAGFESARDCFVVDLIKSDRLFFDGLNILNGVNGKLLGVAKVLHHFAVLTGNGNFHRFILPFRSVASAAAPPLIVRSVPRFAAPYNRNFVNKSSSR